MKDAAAETYQRISIWNIDRKYSVKGYIAKGLLETHNLYTRHEELAQELRRRGYKHNSELDLKWKLSKKSGSIDKESNIKQLIDRCTKCRERHRTLFGGGGDS